MCMTTNWQLDPWGMWSLPTDALPDDPLSKMALSVAAINAFWFAQWSWTMDAYKIGMHAWGYPSMRGDDHHA